MSFSATFSESKKADEQSQQRAESSSNGNSQKVRRRYNPYRDPNFDPNSQEFNNYERKNSMFSKSEIQNLNKILVSTRQPASQVVLDSKEELP
jgi:hypothetical protein